jgi:hypothetical protein
MAKTAHGKQTKSQQIKSLKRRIRNIAQRNLYLFDENQDLKNQIGMLIISQTILSDEINRIDNIRTERKP